MLNGVSRQLKRKIEAGTPSPAPKKMLRETAKSDKPKKNDEEEELPGLTPDDEDQMEAHQLCPHCQRLKEENCRLRDEIDTIVHRQSIRAYHYCLGQLTRWADQENRGRYLCAASLLTPEQLTNRHLHNLMEMRKQANEQMAIEAQYWSKLWGILIKEKCYKEAAEAQKNGNRMQRIMYLDPPILQQILRQQHGVRATEQMLHEATEEATNRIQATTSGSRTSTRRPSGDFTPRASSRP